MSKKQPPPRNNAAIAILAIVLIVVFAVVGAFYFTGRDHRNTNTVGNTNTLLNVTIPTDWHSYTDDTTRLVAKYPSDWITVRASYASVGFRPASLQVASPEYADVYISYLPNPEHLGLKEFYQARQGQSTPFSISGDNYQLLTIGTHEVYFFPLLPSAIANAAALFQVGDYVVDVETHLTNADGVFTYRDIFFAIVGSVTSTTITNTIVPADWQTYTDKTYPFSVSFPNTWSHDASTSGDGGEGPYVLWWHPQSSGSAPLPYLALREDWSADLEARHIEAQDPPYTKVLSMESYDIAGRVTTTITYTTTVGLTFTKRLVSIGSITYIFSALADDSDMERIVGSLTVATKHAVSPWIRYTNDKWGVTFTYAPFLGATAKEDQKSTLFNGKVEDRIYTPGENAFLDIYIINDSQESVRAALDARATHAPYRQLTWTTATVDGVPADRGTRLFGGDDYYENYYVFRRKDRTWVVSTFATGTETDEAIKGFAFLADARTYASVPADWKTYTNDRGFSIQYPPDWSVSEHKGYVTAVTFQPQGASYIVEDSPAYLISLVIYDKNVHTFLQGVDSTRLSTVTIGANRLTRLTPTGTVSGTSYLIDLPTGLLTIGNGISELVYTGALTAEQAGTMRGIHDKMLASLVINQNTNSAERL